MIINTAGLVDVDKCNNNLSLAKKNNTRIVRNLVYSLKKKLKIKPHIIHFSTDQVYNQKTHFKQKKLK